MDISRELEPADILVSYSQAANKFLEILINITTTNKRSTSRANIKKRQAFLLWPGSNLYASIQVKIMSFFCGKYEQNGDILGKYRT